MVCLISAMVRRTSSEICSAFEFGAAKIGIATAGLLSRSERSAYSAAPSSMRATSRNRVTAPFGSVLSTMSPNSCSLESRPCALTESCRSRSAAPGDWPSTPAAACTFCSRIARTTSFAERSCSATLRGSSQTRIE
jgi:hypothetical protein